MTPAEGSSPHARGAHLLRPAYPHRRGIIPACAGSTQRAGRTARPRRDHPRMRGEHVTSIGSPSMFAGSSPHARGAQRADHAADLSAGIIPACVGSTPVADSDFIFRWDHPRMRGEHI